MKIAILLISVFVGALLVQDAEAWRWGGRGWGGRFGGWGGRFGGWGRWGGLGGRWGGVGWGGLGWRNPWALYAPWAGLGYRYFRDTMNHGRLEHRISCSYIPSNSVLVCQREDAGVECEVVANLTTVAPVKNYELFGLGHIWNFDKSTPVNLTRYNLYPRVLDNSAWRNHTTVVAGKTITLNLFHSVTYVPNYYGFRVIESKCFNQLVELFRSVLITNYENITVVNENGPKCNASLFGEVLIKKIKV